LPGEKKLKKTQKVYAALKLGLGSNGSLETSRQAQGKTPRRLISLMDSNSLIENIEGKKESPD
jgi:hypothetical protein